MSNVVRLPVTFKDPNEKDPEIRPIDELKLVEPFLRRVLVLRGLAFQTQARVGDKLYKGTIIAGSSQQARYMADLRGVGEEVIGQVTGISDI